MKRKRVDANAFALFYFFLTKGSYFPVPDNLEESLKEFKNREKLSEFLIKSSQEAYQKKEEELEASTQGRDPDSKDIGEKNMRQVEKYVLLRTIDTLWMDHLDNMEHLRDSVKLRAYGQKDPLVEYKNEGIRLFERLLSSIQATLVSTIFKVSLTPASEREVVVNPSAKRKISDGEESDKFGRNSPCPCGSKKKYKKCCYPKYGR